MSNPKQDHNKGNINHLMIMYNICKLASKLIILVVLLIQQAHKRKIMISISNISQNTQPAFCHKQNNTQNINIQHKQKQNRSLNNKKISFAEGSELLLKGFVKQGTEMITSIVNHPLKTVAVIGGTTLGLMALPLIGVPTAVGGAALAVGFAGMAAAKTIYHATLFAKNNHKGSYNVARKELQQIGENTFDLALSAPFAPKAFTKVKNFTKYGKFNINTELINDVKSTKNIFDKFKVFMNADNELLRKINFSEAVDKELLKINNITDAEKAQIKKELLEFNVETEKIPTVVLQKWAEITGVKTLPDFRYTSLASNTSGCANAGSCTIKLNDFKTNYASTFSDYQQTKIVSSGNNYMITYLQKSTGKTITEKIKKSIYDSYNNLGEQYQKQTPQGRIILTTVHEREHINQFAKISSLKGFEWLKFSITQRGKALYNKMIEDMPKIKFGSPEAMEIESFLMDTSNNPAAYIKRPIEIGARKIETKALNHPTFKKLNNIFERVNKTTKVPIENEIIINDIRAESAST